MTATPFTGERLHEGDALFGVDLERHRVAYRFACDRVGRALVLDLGSGAGYGAAALAAAGARVVGLDRVAPDVAPAGGAGALGFVRGELDALPFHRRRFDWVVSFQVIEHLPDPAGYARAMADLLRPDGAALLTTPNRIRSDGMNPYHLREYAADELAALLGAGFAEVEMLGVAAHGAAARYFAAREARLERVVALDVFQLHRRLPRRFRQWLFGRGAVWLRRGLRRGPGLPAADPADFTVGPASPDCLDLLAVCRRPR